LLLLAVHTSGNINNSKKLTIKIKIIKHSNETSFWFKQRRNGQGEGTGMPSCRSSRPNAKVSLLHTLDQTKTQEIAKVRGTECQVVLCKKKPVLHPNYAIRSGTLQNK